jgi:hypothetical protein
MFARTARKIVLEIGHAITKMQFSRELRPEKPW